MMQVKGLNQSTIQKYAHQTLSNDDGAFLSTSKVASKKPLSGTLHIKNVYAVKKIMANYDLTDMSNHDMKQMSQALFDAGIISREDFQSLAFQPELHPEYHRDSDAVKGVESDTRDRINFIDVWRQKALNHREEGAQKASFHAGLMVNILENLNTTRM